MSRRRTGSNLNVGAGRDWLCGRLRPSGDIWPLCDDCVAAGLRCFWPQPRSGGRSRFLARCDYSQRRVRPSGGRPQPRGRARRPDGACFRPIVYRRRRSSARLRDRASFEADPLRIHEQHRADRPDQPIAKALRDQDRERRTAERRLVAHGRDLSGKQTGVPSRSAGARSQRSSSSKGASGRRAS